MVPPRRRSRRGASRTSVVALFAFAASLAIPAGAAAQATDGDRDAITILLSAARAQYDRDPVCLDPDGWLSTFRLTVERGAFAVTAGYVGAYPWPLPPPPLPGSSFIDRGPAFQVGAELDPLHLLGGEELGRVNRFFRPFLGAGLHVSTDGDTAAEGVNGPGATVAVQGGTDAFVSYGARITVPLGEDGRFGLFGEVRGTSVFAGGKEFVDLQGATLESESSTLTWAEFSVGVRLTVR